MLKSDFRDYLKKNRKKIILLFLIVVLLLSVISIFSIQEYKKSFLIRSGNIIAVRENSGVVSLILKSYGNKEVDEKLTFDTSEISEKKKKEKKGENGKDGFISLFNHIKSSKELREDGFIFLPNKMENGKVLKWHAKIDWSYLSLVLIIPALVIADYKSGEERKRKLWAAQNDSIIKTLPGFNNSLILLLESGLIFDDAFYRIASGYENKSDICYFEKFIIEVKNTAHITGRDFISVLAESAVGLKNRDLSRMGSVFVDSRNKGVPFADKLASESEYLWNERKKHASEKSKKAEIQMTLPLGILLMALILITASPAILQI